MELTSGPADHACGEQAATVLAGEGGLRGQEAVRAVSAIGLTWHKVCRKHRVLELKGRQGYWLKCQRAQKV